MSGQHQIPDIPEYFNMTTLLLDRHLESGAGGREAVVYRGSVLTYEDLLRLTNRAGNALRAIGVRREERVMIMLPDCPEFMAVFLGAMRIGSVPVPVNTLSGPDDYKYYLNDSRASVLVIDQELLTKIEPIRSHVKSLRSVLVYGESSSDHPNLSQLLSESDDRLEPEETHRDEPSYWLYSSGTTGRPKGVVHLHGDMVYCTHLYVTEVLRLTPQDRTFSASRLFFSYGLGNSLYLPLYTGASVVLNPERPDPANVVDTIQKYRPTIFFGVPTFYAALLRYLDSLPSKPDLSSLRLAVSAGEALPAPLCTRWYKATGVEVLDGIGSTEVGYIFISNRPGRVRPGSSGELIPGYEVRLVGEDGADVPVGEVGDLWVKGKSIAAYYWNKRDQSKRTFIGEWLRTGDKYYREPDGYFYFCGRSDDLLRVSGQWVAPIEVEAALMEHGAVAECAVVGAHDDDGLEKPKAFVILKPGYQPSPQLATELQEFVKGRIAPFKYPRWVEFVAELPKTPTGKIQRYKLRV